MMSQVNVDAPLDSAIKSSLPEVDREDLARFQTTQEGNKRTVIASIFFLLVSLFVGVPVWLKTTATYQAPLPFWEIKALCSRPIEITIPIKIISFSEHLSAVDLVSIQSDLTASEDNTVRCGTSPNHSKLSRKLNVHCSVHVREATAQEKNALEQARKQSSKMSDLLSRLESTVLHDDGCGENCSSNSSPFSYTVSILPQSVYALLERIGQSESADLHMDSAVPVTIVHKSPTRNFISLVLPTTGADRAVKTDGLSAHLAKLMNSVFLTMDDLQHLVTPPTPTGSNDTYVKQPVSENEVGAQFAEALTKQLPPSTTYDVTVTVLTNADEEGSRTDASDMPHRSSWNEQLLLDPSDWLSKYVQAAFQSWLPHVHVQFSSQRLHAVDVEQLIPSQMNEDRTYRYYTQDHLSTLVNQLESYLGAPQAASAATRDMAGTKPGLHLILFVAIPGVDSTGNSRCPLPLRFHLPSTWSPFTVTNVALVPQWGGLFAVDAPQTACAPSNNATQADMAAASLLGRQMVSVIRSMLGLPDKKPQFPNLIELASTTQQPGVAGALPPGQVFHSQLDSWFLHRTVESLVAIKVTMTSLIDLLARFPNMVINDHVAHEVTRSTHVWAQTLDALRNMSGVNGTLSDLGAVFQSAQYALESVNSAFFDHSLLGRLYFQEDQKYGIYVPLFLPVGFGILSSTSAAFRILFPRDASP